MNGSVFQDYFFTNASKLTIAVRGSVVATDDSLNPRYSSEDLRVAQDLESQIDVINSGALIPPIEPGDLRAALLFFSDARSVLDHATTCGATAGPLRGIGVLLDDLAARCSAGADVFTIGVRAALADVILQLARANPDRLGGADDDFIIQEVATMPLIGADLKDPKAILLRLDEMTGWARPNSNL